jgi:(1->4)-alpha-D-glucan 1-alpha-D-glucosylmutase
MQRRETRPVYTPSATYRLQFNRSFTFEDATAIAGYLHELGITDLYASPFLMARPGSLHGYDVTDQSRLNPEIGDESSFRRLSSELQRLTMGLIADVVPNHMCISHPSNTWWRDVLENGPSSPFAGFFDIDWKPPKPELENKVLLPVLADQYGRVLENQEIQIAFAQNQFEVRVNGTSLPLAPLTWPMILEPAVAKLRDQIGPSHQHVAEMESIITSLGHLAGPTESDEAKIRERQREKEIVKRRLAALIEASPEVLEPIQGALVEINGRRGDPRSFDRIERLLESQPYRLSFWRVAMDEINYRRFFDINDLAAIRPEEPEVFAAVHALIFDLVGQHQINGFRIDHPDGLFEPERYFRSLQDACRDKLGEVNGHGNGNNRAFYVVAEKILTGSEHLRPAWAIEGSTGYGFLNIVNGLFVDRAKGKAFQQLYRRFTGWAASFDDLVCTSKRLILQVAMSSELNVLARKLDCISEQHRWYRDFTLENLRDALREVLAAFPVYRTYVRGDQTEVDPEDRRQITIAIRRAKKGNPAISESVFDFIQNVLLLEHPDGLNDSQRAERQLFVMRFQQLSAPVMAKGVEDTAFYRYYPLASLNEVGGNPERFGISTNIFHRRNAIRAQLWPHTMNASSTHDTKRSEDVRARINVLSEMPGDWYSALRRWRNMNGRLKTNVDGAVAPDANEEYLFYQTLIGTWPLLPMNAEEHQSYVGRIQAYMRKALHEAKLHSSWINPNGEYDLAVQTFVANTLVASANNPFLQDLRQFIGPIAQAGMWNSISQLLMNIASPGVPDFYQGSELWSFQLVDPDNRGPVDFQLRKSILAKIQTVSDADRAALVDRLMANPCDGAIKLYLTNRALHFRRDQRALFLDRSYVPLATAGSRANHAIAFARTSGNQIAIALAGRFFLKLRNSHQCPTGESVWLDSAVLLPKKLERRSFRDVFTGQTIAVENRDGQASIPLAKAFAHCSVALLTGFEA